MAESPTQLAGGPSATPFQLRFRQLFAHRETGLLLAVFFIWLVGTGLRPDFFPGSINLLDLLRQVSQLGIVAVAMTYVIINKDIDLSVGSVYALATVVFGVLVKFEGWDAWAAGGVVLVVGLLAGLTNGLLATKAKMPAFIATLGMFFLARGLTLALSGGFNIIGFPSSDFYQIAQPNGFLSWVPFFGDFLGDINTMFFIFIAVAVLAWIVLKKTVFGYQVFATGGNIESAKLAGINTDWVRIRAFLFTGFAASLAGLINIAFVKRVSPDVAPGFELSVIAAVVVGGTSLFGGRGSVWGSVLGASILVMVRKIFVVGVLVEGELVRLPQTGTLVFVGGIVVLSILFDIWVRDEQIFKRLWAHFKGRRLPERATHGAAGLTLGTRGRGQAMAGQAKARDPNLLERFLRAPETGVLIMVVALWLIGVFFRPDFFASPENTFNILREIVQLGIIAIAMTYVIINGDIDLSVGSVLALSGVGWAKLVLGGMDLWLAAILIMLLAAGIGLINGVMATKLKMPAFIATLGMLFIARGAATVWSGGQQLNQFPESSFFLIADGNAFLGGFPNQVLIFLVLLLTANYMLRKSSFGYKVFATGGNIEAARRSGINTDWVRIRAFMMTSVLAALTGLILVARVKSFAASLGSGLELNVIAAVIVGGTSLFGGRGSVIGSFLGASVIALLNNILVVGRLVTKQVGAVVVQVVETFPQRWLQIILGIILLTAVLVDIWIREEQLLTRLWWKLRKQKPQPSKT